MSTIYLLFLVKTRTDLPLEQQQRLILAIDERMPDPDLIAETYAARTYGISTYSPEAQRLVRACEISELDPVSDVVALDRAARAQLHSPDVVFLDDHAVMTRRMSTGMQFSYA